MGGGGKRYAKKIDARVPTHFFSNSRISSPPLPQAKVADDLLMADGKWEEEENDTPLASLGADSFLLMTIWNVRCALAAELCVH